MLHAERMEKFDRDTKDFAEQQRLKMCAEIDYEDTDWTLYDPDLALKLAKSKAKDIERKGCVNEAKRYFTHAKSILAAQPKYSPSPTVVVTDNECETEFQKNFDWSQLGPQEAMAAAGKVAAEMKQKPGCELYAVEYLKRVNAIFED